MYAVKVEVQSEGAGFKRGWGFEGVGIPCRKNVFTQITTEIDISIITDITEITIIKRKPVKRPNVNPPPPGPRPIIEPGRTPLPPFIRPNRPEPIGPT